MSQAHEVQQILEEIQALLAHLETASWVEEDWGMLRRVLQSYERLLQALFEAQMTLKRLQTLLFGTRRRRRTPSASGTAEASTEAVSRGEEPGAGVAGSAAVDGETSGAEGSAPRSGGHRPGYGRLGAALYEGADQ